MAQREFYFAKGFSYMSGILSCDWNFMILLQFCYSAGKTILLARSIFSKDYSLKEQTWLVTYAVRCNAARKANPPLLFRPFTLFLKGRHSPAFSFMTCTISHRAMMGKTKAGKLTTRLGLIEITKIQTLSEIQLSLRAPHCLRLFFIGRWGIR